MDPALAEPASQSEPPDIAYTRQMLEGYVAERDSYETVRLEGQRLTDPDGNSSQAVQADVHVYELYWADLSRLGTGVIGVAGAAFQLTSSLAALGLGTIERMLAATKDLTGGRYTIAHRVSIWSLTVLVPWLNLALMSVALSAPIGFASARVQAVATATLTAVGLAWMTGSAWLRMGARVSRRVHVVVGLVFAFLVVGIALGALLSGADPRLNRRLAVLLWGCVSALVMVTLGNLYQQRRDGVVPVAWVVALGVLAGFGFVIKDSAGAPEVAERIVRLFEWLFLSMALTWMVVIVSAGFSGALLWRLGRERPEVKRAAWTAATTLTISIATVSLAAIILWSALLAITTRALPSWAMSELGAGAMQGDSLPSGSRRTDNTILLPTPDGSYAYHSLVPLITLARDDSNSARAGVAQSSVISAAERAASDQVCFARTSENDKDPTYGRCLRFSQRSMPRFMMSLSASLGLLVSLGALALLLVAGLVLAAPSVLREIKPTFRSVSTADGSVPLGMWLTTGFRAFRIATILAFIVVVVGTLSVSALGLWLLLMPGRASWAAAVFAWLRSTSDAMTLGIGSLVAASTVTIVVLLSRFQSVARVVRPVLDVMLDVDNYLRDRPRDRAPRARMLSRFVSLMRYLTVWKREQRGYDAVVFVAHSQGSVLVAEALRFHAQAGFKYLTGKDDRPTLHLMTMGSPLRQLYERSFPHLFEWAGAAEKPDGGPQCHSLGIEQWINVYRSGDYVGRSLWRSEAAASTYDTDTRWSGTGQMPSGSHVGCCERCLGAGAHTHYWDSTADDVAECLDSVLVKLADPAS
ncbi:MAG: hypothetical protein IPK33_08355 [Gemmatimonadetes bacterium]|nr:hypothetical protein [Gemmatimonadota bacterium]